MVFVLNKNPLSTQPYWFTIWSGSNKLAHSEMYARKVDALAAIQSIARNAGDATYSDNTGER